MIPYSRDQKESIPVSAVKIVGLGGAGANMLERIALDSVDCAELLALNTDIRTLGTCLAKEKIQLGVNLTKGLGTGGDPELGQQAMLEAEAKVREALKGQQIVFLCTGLGGGTGSGAAPVVARIAREEGAFVVVFATMPFFFEGRRRRDQAETSLNQLAVLSNALVTFDNNRMGELVLAKQGIHEAFAAADQMISESIKAVIRLVVRPGIINIGLDDLMSALRTTRSRCLFGSGMADGKDRAPKALRNALASPLLDQGALLKDAQTVLVHLSGGESLTLFEIELLMQDLQKHVPDDAHVLFGAAIDPAMGDNLSVTLISALPEDSLTGRSKEPAKQKAVIPEPSHSPDNRDTDTPPRAPELEIYRGGSEQESTSSDGGATSPDTEEVQENQDTSSTAPDAPSIRSAIFTSKFNSGGTTSPDQEPAQEDLQSEEGSGSTGQEDGQSLTEPPPISTQKKEEEVPTQSLEATPYEEESFAGSGAILQSAPKSRPAEKPLWGKDSTPKGEKPAEEDPFEEELAEGASESQSKAATQLKLDSKYPGSQSELSFGNAPRGRFEGENPNVFDGEDLDLPPFLRKKKS